MEPFARIIIGYHGCTEAFANKLLLARTAIREWRASTNDFDWLGHGIYFWEHAPERALRWARDRYRTRRERPSILGAYVQLGRCFDLLNEAVTSLLSETYDRVLQTFIAQGQRMPENRGPSAKRRDLDCAIINHCVAELQEEGIRYDTVRGAFLEGTSAYPGASFSREGHIQIAVRNSACILGVFRPNI